MIRTFPAVAMLGATLAIQGGAAAAQTAARADRTRDIYVSVVDRRDAPVRGLTVADFVVREDGVAREVLKVEPATSAMQVVLIVDDSAAAEPAIRDMREALNAFIAKLQGKAEIGLVSIGERPTSLVELTNNLDALKKGVSRIFARQGAGAYFLEGLSDVARGFRKREAPRKAIVALITEGVEFSNMYSTTVLNELYASRATLHVLSIGRPNESMSDEMRNRGIVLDEGTTRTGGRRDQILATSGLADNMRRVADELLNQYLVTYGAPESLIPPEKIDVMSTRKDVRVRARTRIQAK
jgi:VWFA-related protein